MSSPTIVYERPHEEETLSEIRRLTSEYEDLRQQAAAKRVELHTKVREANRVQGIKQETIGSAMVTEDNPDGVTKSRVYAIITSLDEHEEDDDG